MKVLVVDDDKNIRTTLSISLIKKGHTVKQAESVKEAISFLKEENFDFLLSDFKMEEASGLELLEYIKSNNIDIISVIMTAYASFENAVEVIKTGAYDYLPKPFTKDQLLYLLRKVEQITNLKKENKQLKKLTISSDYFQGLTSNAMKHLQEFIDKVAPTDATVLITGESGTGKSYLAKLIHELSDRSEGPFAEIHCTTLTDTLIESELFGHAKGSFTGAHKDKKGKIQEADGGSVFLDEIGDLSLQGQAKLLRFLQEQVIDPVGSNKSIKVNTRVIAATNKDLKEMVLEGKFREDLYYRLNMFECLVTPLRHRKEDIPLLVKKFLNNIRAKKDLEYDFIIPSEMQDIFNEYNWPGNIRELKNTIERLCFLSNGPKLNPLDLPKTLTVKKEDTLGKEEVSSGYPPYMSLEDVEKDHIKKILQCESNLDKAADTLGITSVTLWRKRKQYGLP